MVEIFPTAPVLVFCMKSVCVFFQKKKAIEFEQEPKAQFGYYIFFNGTHCYLLLSPLAGSYFLFKVKAQIAVFGCQLLSLVSQ